MNNNYHTPEEIKLINEIKQYAEKIEATETLKALNKELTSSKYSASFDDFFLRICVCAVGLITVGGILLVYQNNNNKRDVIRPTSVHTIPISP